MNIKGITIYAKSHPPYSLDKHTKDVVLSLADLANSFEKYEGYSKDEYDKDLWKAAFFSALFHDIGKIDYYFQKTINLNVRNAIVDIKKNLELKELIPSSCIKRPPENRHNLISYIYLNAIILSLNRRCDSELRHLLAVAALVSLLHHFKPLYDSMLYTNSNKWRVLNKIIHDEDLPCYVDFLQENIDEISENYLSLLANIDGNLSVEPLNDAAEMAKTLFKELKDYSTKDELAKIKSNIKDIKYLSIEEDIINNESDFIRKVLGLLMRVDHFSSSAIGISGLKIDLGPISVVDNVKRKLMQIAGTNVWQLELLKNTENGNICLIAPTGSGKTEYAILRNGMRKMIYTLPLRVSLNDLYQNRFIEYLGNSGNEYLGLLHSTNFIEYAQQENREGPADEGDILIKVLSSKNLAPPFILSTPDQTLLFSLRYFGSEKIESMLPLTHVVLDEVQAYNPSMFAIIGNTIDILKENGAKITVMTATLPAYMKQLLSENFSFNLVDVTEPAYENINVKNLHLYRHVVEYEELSNEEEFINAIKNKIKKAIERNLNKILIVVNTVSLSLKIYEAIKEDQNLKFTVLLFHSRMLERVKDEILNKFRKTNKVILVATQTIEASVNIDADYIITQIAPPDSLIQRIGRVYRNRDSDYTQEEPNVSVLKLPFEKDPMVNKKYYDKELMRNTEKVLNDSYLKKPLDFSLEKKFVEEVTSEDSIKSKFINKYENEKNYFSNIRGLPFSPEEIERLFRNISSVTLYISNFINIKNEDDLLKLSVRIELYKNSISLPFFVYNKLEKILNNKNLQNILSWDEELNGKSKFRLFIKVNDQNSLNLIEEEGLEGILDKISLSSEDIEEADWNIL